MDVATLRFLFALVSGQLRAIFVANFLKLLSVFVYFHQFSLILKPSFLFLLPTIFIFKSNCVYFVGCLDGSCLKESMGG